MNVTLAAGSQDRWNNGNDSMFSVKQLIEIEGETLIERIQQQFGGYVVTHRPEIIEVSDLVFKPEKNRWTVETLYSTRSLWEGQTIVTLGDVYYTDEAVNTIKSFSGPIQFFGTIHEIFAISFTDYPRVTQCLTEHITKLQNMVTYPSHGKLWQLYRRYNNYSYRENKIGEYFTFIEDRTQDFDSVDELKSFR